MPVIKGLEWTFDTVASKYEKFRPGYTDELYKMIFDYITIDNFSNVVEVGIGGGQATLPVLQTGCTLTAIEYGENFSKLCEEKFKEYKNFSVITDKFENVSFADSEYDLVYSASAFHWVPEDIGYSKVYDMLKSGGVLQDSPIIPIVIRVIWSFRKKLINYMLNIIVNTMEEILRQTKNIVKTRLGRERKLLKNMVLLI